MTNFSMHMRKLLALILVLGLLTAACGSTDSPEDSAATADTTTSATETEAAPEEEPEAAQETETEAEAEVEPEAAPDASASGEPLRIGGITSLSGIITAAETTTAAQLVFDRYNAAGGLDGRPIEFIIADAQDTAEGAAAAAKQLVEEDDVLALCCGGGVVDCTTNAGYYAENDMQVVLGIAACAEALTVHPVNTGPFLPFLHVLDYFHYDLGYENICVTAENSPLAPIFQGVFLPMWEQFAGVTLNQITVEPGEDLTPLVSKLSADGCDAVMAGFSEPGYQALFQTVSAQGMRDEIAWGMLTSGYSQTLLDAAGDNLEGVYAASEFEPFTGDPASFSGEVQDFLALLDANGETPTSFGQGGYLAANIMISALESIDGEVTRESANAAIAAITYESELIGAPFMATGFQGPVQPNPFSMLVQVQDGEFQRVSDFVAFPRQG